MILKSLLLLRLEGNRQLPLEVLHCAFVVFVKLLDSVNVIQSHLELVASIACLQLIIYLLIILVLLRFSFYFDVVFCIVFITFFFFIYLYFYFFLFFFFLVFYT